MYKFKTGIFTNKLDYSGYDRNSWPVRTLEEHKAHSLSYLMQKTASGQQAIVSEFGVRYSILQELPYFDPIRHHVIDPMHNLLLGTSKMMMYMWIDGEIIIKANLGVIEERVRTISTPKDIGRLPLKISSSFAGFTADQWRNWTIIYSPVVLKGLLPSPHLRCWLLFVKACSLLCKRIIYNNEVTSAELYLEHFCKNFEQLYGAEHCTPNMRLHLHLKNCLLDYGPVYSFWCFPFERYNGILGAYHTNHKQIEPQIDHAKVFERKATRCSDLPQEYSNFIALLPKSHGNKGSLECAKYIVEIPYMT